MVEMAEEEENKLKRSRGEKRKKKGFGGDVPKGNGGIYRWRCC